MHGQTHIKFSPNLEMRAVPHLVSFTLAFAFQLRKITENLSQGSRKSVSWHVSGSTVSADVCQAVQLTGSPHQLTWSRISDVVGEVGDSQIVVNLPVTNVPALKQPYHVLSYTVN
jgi:hypothetical protein